MVFTVCGGRVEEPVGDLSITSEVTRFGRRPGSTRRRSKTGWRYTRMPALMTRISCGDDWRSAALPHPPHNRDHFEAPAGCPNSGLESGGCAPVPSSASEPFWSSRHLAGLVTWVVIDTQKNPSKSSCRAAQSIARSNPPFPHHKSMVPGRRCRDCVYL